jgi:hypothetical protein
MGRLTEHRIKTQLRYPLHRIFKWPDWNVGPDTYKGKQTMWETNHTTKMMMIGSLRQWLKERLFIVRDPGLQHELSNYRVVRGLFKPVGAFADRIIAAALCVMGVEQSEWKFRDIVIGAKAVRDTSAHGAAARILRTTKVSTRPPEELPDEFAAMGITPVRDVWDFLEV